jgi:5,10-methylenetetrahydromethanopterin reductase
MGVRLEVGLHPDRPIAETADIVVEAERLGYPGVWIADSQNIFRDAYAALTLAAARTSRVTLGTGVTNPLTRHPAVIAGALATIDELSGGRMLIGMGTGETAVESLGLGRAKLATMERVARIVAGLQGEQRAQLDDGTEITMEWTSRRIPIIFASTGPRSLRLAGRVADGVYLKIGVDPALVRYARRMCEAGRRDAGRTMEGFRVQSLVPVAVSEDRDEARDQVRGFAAAIARAALLAVPREDVPSDLWDEIQELERASSAARERQSYVEWLESPQYRELISDRIVDAFAIAGTPSEVVEGIARLGELGVDAVVAPLTMQDPWPQLRALGTQVLPRLGGAAVEA